MQAYTWALSARLERIDTAAAAAAAGLPAPLPACMGALPCVGVVLAQLSPVSPTMCESSLVGDRGSGNH
jgi:hypothetical protein